MMALLAGASIALLFHRAYKRWQKEKAEEDTAPFLMSDDEMYFGTMSQRTSAADSLGYDVPPGSDVVQYVCDTYGMMKSMSLQLRKMCGRSEIVHARETLRYEGALRVGEYDVARRHAETAEYHGKRAKDAKRVYMKLDRVFRAIQNAPARNDAAMPNLLFQAFIAPVLVGDPTDLPHFVGSLADKLEEGLGNIGVVMSDDEENAIQ